MSKKTRIKRRKSHIPDKPITNTNPPVETETKSQSGQQIISSGNFPVNMTFSENNFQSDIRLNSAYELQTKFQPGWIITTPSNISKKSIVTIDSRAITNDISEKQNNELKTAFRSWSTITNTNFKSDDSQIDELPTRFGSWSTLQSDDSQIDEPQTIFGSGWIIVDDTVTVPNRLKKETSNLIKIKNVVLNTISSLKSELFKGDSGSKLLKS